MSLTIKTNTSSLIAQNSLKTSTSKLNQAIERMSSGAKINHAKDNAANFAIATNMTTQLSSLDIAEENTAMGLDLLTTANETLDLINERTERLRNLAMQAENGTYGKDSLNAINAECVSLVAEIKNLYSSAEYNGIKILGQEFFETIPTNATSAIATMSLEPLAAETVLATENTTLLELGINASSFEIYNSVGAIIEAYDTEGGDTLQDVFNVLSNYGLNSSINDGVIHISSTNGNYVNGDLISDLGITLKSEDYISSTEQSLGSKIYYTLSQAPTETTTLGDLGVLTSGKDTIIINDKYQDLVAKITVGSSTTLGGLFNELGKYDIQGSIDDSCITLSSSSNNYVVSNGVIQLLGITNNTVSSIVTTGTGQTSAGEIKYETITTVSGTVTTVQEVQTETIWTTTTTSQTVTSTVWTTTTSSSTKTDTIWTTTTSSTTQTDTVWITTTSSATQTSTIYTTTTVANTSAMISVTPRDTSGMTSLASVDETVKLTSGTYSISTAEELAKLATMTNNGLIGENTEFVLANDIDLSAYSTDEGWTPIGTTSSNSFGATFDGNGYKISNLYINRPNKYYSGLFGFVIGTIKNVGVVDCNIAATGGTMVGGLVGGGKYATISNCYVAGSVTAYECVGGLVGYDECSTISNCYVVGSVTASLSVGGLVGNGWRTTISNCYTIGSVYGDDNVGGLAGECCGTISNCYTTASAANNGRAGALVGYCAYGTYNDAYYADTTGQTAGIGSGTPTSGTATIVTTEELNSLIADGTLPDYSTVTYVTSITSTTKTETVWTTTTTPTTQTSTIYTTTTSSSTKTETVWTTTTSSATKTDTVWTTTTSSTTKTETVNVTTTTEATYTTSNILMTSDSTFANLGVSSRTYITIKNNATTQIITIKTADTVGDLISKLNKSGISAAISGGKITLTPNKKSTYILGMSDSLKSALNLDNNFYSISDGFDMTDSNSLISNTTLTINRETNLSDLSITSGALLVQKSGADYATITVSTSETINDFSNNLFAIGFNVSCENGKFKIKAAGDMVLSESASNSSNAIAVLGLDNINKSISSTYSNTDSEQLFTLDEIITSYWAASGSIALQVGITSDESSRIEFDTGFVITNIDRFASIGKNTITKFDYISELDSILNQINNKQVEFGAVENRLMSALEQISVSHDNLVSSRSTIQDADMAEVSSEYIRQQILQEASATLMATANQSPSIALQLL